MLEPWIIEQIRRREEEERRRIERDRPRLELPVNDPSWPPHEREQERDQEDDREREDEDDREPKRGVVIIGL
jgi:hypothetical protein